MENEKQSSGKGGATTEADETATKVLDDRASSFGVRTHLRSRIAARLAARVGAALVVWSGVIHLELYFNGYRQIPPIGSLFLAQSIAAFVIAIWLFVRPRLLGAIAGALLMAGTLGGFLLSTGVGLFGFHDSFAATDAGMAFCCEVAGTIVFVAVASAGRFSGESWY